MNNQAASKSSCGGNTNGLLRAASYIFEAFSRTDAECSEQPYKARSLEVKNIIARFGPSAGQRIVIGAHYDACGPRPGADDNASGIAGLLELARLLDHYPLKTPVELVAFSTEEPPFFATMEMGSTIHAKSLSRAGCRVRAMICLEMIGYYTSIQPKQIPLLSFMYPRNGNFVALVGRWEDRHLVRSAKRCFSGATTVPAVSYSGPEKVGIDMSDQRNYWALGYPAIMVTDTAHLRNLNYHSLNDTANILDYKRMSGVVDGVFSTIVHLANGN